jgi:alanyl-tRNA synthetase
MGFERGAAVLQGKSSNYDTDVFTPIIARIQEVTGRPYETGPAQVAMRVIADHIRMLTFAIADGAIPGNDGRGYVLRRILRRAARFGRNLGMREPFIHRITGAVVESMGSVFPEIQAGQAHIERIVRAEEESFNATLDRGLEIFASALERVGDSKVFPGEDAFKLYDTFGFPLDLTELLVQERGLTVDVETYNALLKQQSERGRAAGRMDAEEAAAIMSRMDDVGESEFVGYTQMETSATVRKVLDGKYVSLDRTPFYVESGGQVDDTGTIRAPGLVAQVVDSFKRGNRILHEIRIIEGDPSALPGSPVDAVVDIGRRLSIQRNHSATHLVHEALRRVLGSHLHQHGSLVAPDRLRFDFNHFERIPPDRLRQIEEIVNRKIADAVTVNALNNPADWLSIEEAKRRYPNVKMFFGDKYGDRVRIVEIDPSFSVELCGGTHVTNTSDIGLFKILSEGGIASGIRRIEAVTGDGIRLFLEEQLRKIGSADARIERLREDYERLARETGAPAPHLPPAGPPVLPGLALTQESVDAVERAFEARERAMEFLTHELHGLEKEAARGRVRSGSAGLEALIAGAQTLDGFKLVAARVDAAGMEELKELGDALRAKLGSGVGVLGAVIDDKAALVAVVTDDLIKGRHLQAGKIVGALAALVGGGGGGRPHLATAGGKDAGKLDEALRNAEKILRELTR